MSVIVYAELSPRRRIFASSVHVCAGVAAARAVGHTVIEHPNRKSYEAVTLPDTPVPSTLVRAIAVRNHTADELLYIRGVLDRLPQPIVDGFAARYTGIVCVDWTGSNWRDATHPNPTTLLSGGANMDQPRNRGGITEAGRRIELTHSALYELRPPPFHRRGTFTLWHELGHVAFRLGLTPRTVQRTYGQSIHTGAEEQPAYAFMWYFLDPSRLTANDRAAFNRLFP
jgi:hypothetical protein